MTVQEIQDILRVTFDYKFYAPNVFLYYWESDFFIVTNSDYGIEFEIKLSKSDFNADFKKRLKHQALQKGEAWRTFWTSSKLIKFDKPHQRPNKFYYVCPENLIPLEKVPSYAGLVYINHSAKVIKKAPFIHKEKPNYKELLCGKFFSLWVKEKNKNYYNGYKDID